MYIHIYQHWLYSSVVELWPCMYEVLSLIPPYHTGEKGADLLFQTFVAFRLRGGDKKGTRRDEDLPGHRSAHQNHTQTSK